MKKAFCAAVASVLVLVCSVGVAESYDFDSMTTEQLQEMRIAIDAELSSRIQVQLENGSLGVLEFEEMKINVLDYVIGSDSKGNPSIGFNYEFANGSSEEKEFYFMIQTVVYQGGKQCSATYGIDGVDMNSNRIKVKDGASVETGTCFTLYDSTTPVDVEVSFIYDFKKTVGALKFTLPVVQE